MNERGPNLPAMRISIIDVFMLLGVIGVFTLTAVPVLARSGEHARRAQCQNHLKTIVLASNDFALVHSGFAPATTYHRIPGSPTGEAMIGSIYCRLLPGLDEQDLYNSINFGVPMSSLRDIPPQNTTATGARISLFQCASDPMSARPDLYQHLNYRANLGLGELGVRLRYGVRAFGPPNWSLGAFDEMRSVPTSEFTDGLGNTIAFAEKLTGSGRKRFDPVRDWIPAAAADPLATADDWARTCANLPRSAAASGRTDSGRCWMLAGPLFSTFQGTLPPNSAVPDCGADVLNGVGAFGARSLHPGGLNVAMADGSVHWVSSSLRPKLWEMMLTRSAGNVYDESY